MIRIARIREVGIPSVEDVLKFLIRVALFLFLTSFVVCFVWFALVTLGGLGQGLSWIGWIHHDLSHHHYKFSLNWNNWSPAEYRLIIWIVIASIVGKKVWSVLERD